MNDGIPPGSICQLVAPAGRNNGKRVRILDWARRYDAIRASDGKETSSYGQRVEFLDEYERGPFSREDRHISVPLSHLRPIEVAK